LAVCLKIFNAYAANKSERPVRQGLNKVARKHAGALPACRAGDLGSPRKAAGQLPCMRGLPVKARKPPQKTICARQSGIPALIPPWLDFFF
jgi:hypothetical protein